MQPPTYCDIFHTKDVGLGKGVSCNEVTITSISILKNIFENKIIWKQIKKYGQALC